MELLISVLIYVIGLVIHIVLFKRSSRFYNYIDNVIDVMNPSAWCLVWPGAWILVFSLHYINKLLLFVCSIINYFINK